MMYCPSCGQDGRKVITTKCLDENPEGPEGQLEFAVCIHCDYGINEHTEGMCDCRKVRTFEISELVVEEIHTILCPGGDEHVAGACQPLTSVIDVLAEHEVG